MENDNPLTFDSMDVANDDRFNSFAMMAYHDTQEIISIAKFEEQWSIGLYARHDANTYRYIRIPWGTFLQIVLKFSDFIVREDQALLDELKDDLEALSRGDQQAEK